MATVDGQKNSKLNLLLRKLPPGGVATQEWLWKQGVYRQLSDVYCKSGWLRKIGRGVYVRAHDDASWTGGLYAIQQQTGLPIHVGGKTALQRNGLAHFLPLGEGGAVFLFSKPSARLPKWFREHDWGVNIHYCAPQLFDSAAEIGLTKEDIGQYAITLSSPERAIMEVLHFVPKEESFESAMQLMEGLTTLRPHLVQELLEKCRSVKVVRLFLFLAEECGHDWVNNLVMSRMDLGTGKRVIVKDGRLDPIYNITVANAPFTHPKRQMRDLQNKRKKSPAVRLMCPEEDATLIFGKECGCFGSILYLAFERGNLPILDQLLKDFQIEKRGSNDFKRRLKEGWLQKIPAGDLKKIKKGSHNVLAALIELVVAQHIKKSNAQILNLEAWEKCSDEKLPDIRWRDKEREWNAEVKYIDQSPEWLENIVKQLKTGKPEARWFDERACVNYYFGRIAEAAQQLEDGHYDYGTRQIWIVFDALAGERELFERCYLKGETHWYCDTDGQKVVLEMISKRVKDLIRYSPAEWIKKTSELVLATFDSWSLKNIKKYQTSKLFS